MDQGGVESCVKALARTERIAESVTLLRRIGALIGLPLVAALDDISTTVPLTDEDGNRLAELLGWDTGAVDAWVDQNFTLTSPVTVACRFEHLPFYWEAGGRSSVDTGREPVQRKVMEWYAEQGFHGSIVAPVHLSRGRVGSVSWIATQPGIDIEKVWREHRQNLGMAALQFMEQVDRARGIVPPETAFIYLTPREVECLAWSARGKTDQEIGAILGIAPATARFHIENAAQKLNAVTRTQAVAKAAQLGIIGPAI